MKLRRNLSWFALGGAVTLLSVGIAACNSPTDTQSKQEQSSSPQDTAQTMPGMNHSSGTSSGTPSSTPMPEMDHSATNMSAMNMSLGPKDQSFDLRFIDAMIPHHEGAVAMAKQALDKSSHPEVKQLAQAIIEAQQKEISQMKQWRQQWYPDAGSEPVMYDAQMGHTMPMSDTKRSEMMMNQDLGAADNQFDRRFLDAMIPHHEGAVAMAQEALEKSDRPEIKQLAQSILDGQQSEISQMKQWRQKWYGQ